MPSCAASNAGMRVELSTSCWAELPPLPYEPQKVRVTSFAESPVPEESAGVSSSAVELHPATASDRVVTAARARAGLGERFIALLQVGRPVWTRGSAIRRRIISRPKLIGASRAR